MNTLQFVIIFLTLLAGFGVLYLHALASEKAKTRVLNENLKHFTNTAESIKKNIELETSIRSGLHADTKAAVIAAYEALGAYKDYLSIIFYEYSRLTSEKLHEMEERKKILRQEYIVKRSKMELYLGGAPVMDGFGKVTSLCSQYSLDCTEAFSNKVYRDKGLSAIGAEINRYSQSSVAPPDELMEERKDLLKEKGKQFTENVEKRTAFIDAVTIESEKLRQLVFEVISKPPTLN